jgi:hypothetical protein
MGGFVSSTSSVTRHDVFAIERTPPAVVRAAGTGRVWLIGQFPWGPDGVVYAPTDPADRMLTFAPPGMSHTGSGYLATIRKAWADLRICRVLGPTAPAKATKVLNDTAVPCITVDAKYKGSAGNSISIVVSDPSDGDANHFNMTVSVTGASGTTEDFFKNLNYSGVGTNSTPDLSQARLVGAITLTGTPGRPDNGTFTMAGGGDGGSITSAEYVGTAGTGDKGMALVEAEKGPGTVFTDDPGNSIRAAVNAGLKALAALKKDRICVIKGNSGQTLAQAQTDVANYRDQGCVYVDSWVRIYDDVDGTLRLVGGDAFMASVLSQTAPSTSPAWKDPEVQAMLAGIIELESARGEGAGSNTSAGICTIIPEEDGGFTFEAGVTTIAPSDPRRRNITRSRMGHYMATAVTKSLRSYVDAPNVPLNQNDVVAAIDRFGRGLVAASARDPNHTPHLLAWEIQDLKAWNSQADLDSGKFIVPAKAKTSSAMEQIFFSVEYGETVQITAQ